MNRNRDPRRGQPAIEQLVFSSDILQKLNHSLKFVSKTPQTRRRAIRQMLGADCYGNGNLFGCEEIPTKKIIYDMDGATLVEFYCENCFPKDFK